LQSRTRPKTLACLSRFAPLPLHTPQDSRVRCGKACGGSRRACRGLTCRGFSGLVSADSRAGASLAGAAGAVSSVCCRRPAATPPRTALDSTGLHCAASHRRPPAATARPQHVTTVRRCYTRTTDLRHRRQPAGGWWRQSLCTFAPSTHARVSPPQVRHSAGAEGALRRSRRGRAGNGAHGRRRHDM